MKKFKIFLLLGVIFGYSACENKPKAIDIGVILFETGGAAAYGENCKQGMDLALDEINENGVQKLNLIYVDDQSKPEKAVSAFSSLLSLYPEIPAYIAALTSSSTLAIAPIAEKNKKILFSSCSSSPLITDAGDYIFRNWPSDNVEGNLMVKFANQRKFKNVGLIAINNEYGIGLKKVFKYNFLKSGGKIVFEENFNENETNFKALVNKIKNYNIDAIYAPSHAKEAGRLLKTLRDNGILIPVLGCVTYESQDIFETGGVDLRNVYFSTPWFDSSNENKISKGFVEKYVEKYGKVPDNFAAQSYDAVNILYSTIEAKGYNSDSIKQYLYQLKDYPGVSGVTSFDVNGDVVKSALIKCIENKSFKIINEIK